MFMKYSNRNNFFLKVVYRFRLYFHKYKGFPTINSYRRRNGFKALHVSAFNYGNSGDIILPVVLRELFERYIPISKWESLHVSEYVTDEQLNWINGFDFVVIGGGGLFISDSNKNHVSGWQWNISSDSISKIKPPLIVFAVGYNQFRGQMTFPTYFDENLLSLYRNSAFFGLRNFGSIRKVQGHIGEVEIKMQPCMTTIVNSLYNDRYSLKHNEKKGIAVNIALDRQSLRGLTESVLDRLARMIYSLSLIDDIIYVVHVPDDRGFLSYLDAYSVKYTVKEPWDPDHMLRVYSGCKLAIGMRGHAQMVPFGVTTPIISLVSHDKMAFFLEDNGIEEYGFEISEVDILEEVTELVKKIYENYPYHVDLFKRAQERIWIRTDRNMTEISNLLMVEHN